MVRIDLWRAKRWGRRVPGFDLLEAVQALYTLPPWAWKHKTMRSLYGKANWSPT